MKIASEGEIAVDGPLSIIFFSSFKWIELMPKLYAMRMFSEGLWYRVGKTQIVAHRTLTTYSVHAIFDKMRSKPRIS